MTWDRIVVIIWIVATILKHVEDEMTLATGLCVILMLILLRPRNGGAK